jgi:hypothetical protein
MHSDINSESSINRITCSMGWGILCFIENRSITITVNNFTFFYRASSFFVKITLYKRPHAFTKPIQKYRFGRRMWSFDIPKNQSFPPSIHCSYFWSSFFCFFFWGKLFIVFVNCFKLHSLNWCFCPNSITFIILS